MRPRQSGMTLIELLLATLLLAAGLGIAFSAMRGAVRTMASAEILLTGSEQMRTTRGLLRRQLAQAHPVAWAEDRQGRAILFDGGSQHMRFVAPLPGVVSEGGLFVQSLWIEPRGGTRALMFGYRMLDDGNDESAHALDPERPLVLVEDVGELRFVYRGHNDDGMLDDWRDTWEAAGRMPLLVRVEMASGDGRLSWPELTLPVRMAIGAQAVMGAGEGDGGRGAGRRPER